MSREASYGKTKLNNAREDEAVSVLLQADACFQRPDSKARKRILELMGLAGYSVRAFDLVRTETPAPPLSLDNVHEHLSSLTLIEVKATKAPIEDQNLYGFFFGATDNEYQLARKLGERYKFAFVVLRPKSGQAPFYVLLTHAEVEAKTRTKRIQYQVNLHGRVRP
jgi:hypothetical protein